MPEKRSWDGIDEEHSICFCSRKFDVCLGTRLNIAFVVGMLGRYQSNPGLDPWKAAKKVMTFTNLNINPLFIYFTLNF